VKEIHNEVVIGLLVVVCGLSLATGMLWARVDHCQSCCDHNAACHHDCHECCDLLKARIEALETKQGATP
jgi:hypothetical protein